ncbi:hypothetical protein ACWEPM_11805 [Streptomyces sp. NPDC004244]|uniref:hypothetical protein n=1 Tax=Streptomyces sp. NPDC101206 TaxID=3366128 RepID=UPI00382E04A2
MSYAASRPTGVHAPRGALTGPLSHRTARAVVLALLLALCPAPLTLASTAELHGAPTVPQSALLELDIPLCC